MRQLFLCAVVSVFGLTACGGGGGGSSDGASSPIKGTGYLKIEIPHLPEAGVSAASVGTLAQVIDAGSYVDAPMMLANATQNLNTPEACIGSPSNIPFVICIVESLGINAPGTYVGPTPKGEAARVVVSDITGDPDGYTLQAEATLIGNSKKIFLYKADADGKKGVIEVKPDDIFATNSPGVTGIRIAWDATAVISQALEYTNHYSGTSGAFKSEQVSYVLAVVNGLTGVADIASRYYMYVDSNTGFVEANSRFSQSRVGFDRAIVMLSSCTNDSSPVEGTECFAPSTATLNELESGKPMTCGTISSSGPTALTVTDSKALSNSTPGSWAYTGTFATDTACETLRSTVGAGDAFIIRLDKDDAPAMTLKGIHHVMRSKAYADLKLLSSPGFL